MEDLKNIKVRVRSLSTSSVVYSSEIRHVRREWLREGQVILIPADELQEVLFDQGVYNLFAMGYLGIDNPDHRELVGLDYEGSGSQMVPFDKKRAEILLLETDLEAFKQRLALMHGKTGEIDTLINTAYEIKNVSYDKQQIIKAVFGIDLSNLIKNGEEN